MASDPKNSAGRIGSDFKDDIINLWKTKESPDFEYFVQADSESWLNGMWIDGSPFRKLFDKMELTRTAEIACGFGRHSSKIVDRCEELYLIDTSVDGLNVARERFSSHPHVKFILSEDGVSLPGIDDGSLTAVFSYDAMVHFEPLTMASYIAECGRTLKTGGMACLHHSNYSGNPTGRIDKVPGWRNYMTLDLLSHFASRSSLFVAEPIVIDWSFEGSDRITLLVRQ